MNDYLALVLPALFKVAILIVFQSPTVFVLLVRCFITPPKFFVHENHDFFYLEH